MKVISTPNWQQWSMKTKCPGCDSQLEIEGTDIAYEPPVISADKKTVEKQEKFVALCTVCREPVPIGPDTPKFLLTLARRRRAADDAKPLTTGGQGEEDGK